MTYGDYEDYKNRLRQRLQEISQQEMTYEDCLRQRLQELFQQGQKKNVGKFLIRRPKMETEERTGICPFCEQP